MAEVLPDDFMMLQADDGPPVRYQSYLLRLRRVWSRPASAARSTCTTSRRVRGATSAKSPHELAVYLLARSDTRADTR